MTERSPWWYRGRGLVFFAIYFLGFWIGAGAGRLTGTSAPLVVWLGTRLGGDGAVEAAIVIATLFMIGCWAIRAWGSSYLRAHVVWNPDAMTHAFVTDGPFRYTRNPLYLGNLFMAVAFGSLGTPIAFATIVVGNIVFIYALIAYESQGLRGRYGEAFENYERRVPALLPRIGSPSFPATKSTVPSRAQGLRSEIFTGVLALGFIGICIFQDRAFFAFPILLGGGWLLQTFLARRTDLSPPARSG